jgi:hypothetical protein
MRREIAQFALAFTLLLPLFVRSQTAQKPKLPGIPSQELIAWSRQQVPQPVEGQSDPQMQPAVRTFAGMIVKSGQKYVLTTADNVIYDLDDQERAQRFEGQQVQVTGKLDKSSSLITVRDIKAAA